MSFYTVAGHEFRSVCVVVWMVPVSIHTAGGAESVSVYSMGRAELVSIDAMGRVESVSVYSVGRTKPVSLYTEIGRASCRERV